MSEILRAANRAKELVQQILTFSRKTEQELKPTLITPIAKEAIRFLRASLPSDITIEQRVDNNVGPILGDPTQIHQILMNLCTNAAYAMREKGGILTVDLGEVEVDEKVKDQYFNLDPGTYVRLEVSDTGEGIPWDIA